MERPRPSFGLALDPAERPTAAELAEELEELLASGSGIQAATAAAADLVRSLTASTSHSVDQDGRAPARPLDLTVRSAGNRTRVIRIRKM